MKGYKAFKPGWVCRDFQYEIGKTYELPEDQKLQICKCGFHFCKNPIDVFGYYSIEDGTLFAEVEALGDIQYEGTKYCTNKIRIVREFTIEELEALMTDNRGNTGHDNTGFFNSGDNNTGNYNSGSGNAGCRNSGNHNNGSGNTGKFNVGDCNTGCHNIGDYNNGHYNIGNYNAGDGNSGMFNEGDYNTGIFNTDSPKMRAFNRECDMTFAEFCIENEYFPSLLDRIYNRDLCSTDYELIRNLPNFDADIFYEITRIRIPEEESDEVDD